MWAKDDATMAGTMRHMWNKGGFKPFFAAYRVTAVREGLMRPTHLAFTFAPSSFPLTRQYSLYFLPRLCVMHP
jgi:hypothetical protein